MNTNEIAMAIFIFRQKAEEAGLSKKAIEDGENMIISRALEDSKPRVVFEPEFPGMFVLDGFSEPRTIEELSCVLEYEEIMSSINEDRSSRSDPR